jgi:hypothetical protein
LILAQQSVRDIHHVEEHGLDIMVFSEQATGDYMVMLRTLLGPDGFIASIQRWSEWWGVTVEGTEETLRARFDQCHLGRVERGEDPVPPSPLAILRVIEETCLFKLSLYTSKTGYIKPKPQVVR